MRAEGYGADVNFEDVVLTIQGKGLGKAALGSGQRQIPLMHLQSMFIKDASMLVNGQLELVTARGKTIVHFRRKQAADMKALYAALAAAVPGVPRQPSNAPLDAGDVGDKLASLATGPGGDAQPRLSPVEQAREELSSAMEDVTSFTPIGGAEAAAMGVMLAKGERLYLQLEGASCVEIRHAAGQFQGRSQGVSFRIAKGVSYRVGGSRGAYLPGPESPTAIDTGTVLITDQRIIFRGPRESREWQLDKLTGVEHSPDGSWTALPVTNRQKTSGIGYGVDISGEVRLRLQLALADYHGSRDHLRRQVEEQLAALPPA